jgi:urease gamma subunit
MKSRREEAQCSAQAGSLAQKRLARGVKLNTTEATALIASVLQELVDLLNGAHGKLIARIRFEMEDIQSPS